MESMYWNRERLASNLSAYAFKGISLPDYLSQAKKIILDQVSQDRVDESDHIIPDENDKFEIIPPENIGRWGFNNNEILLTIEWLSEFEQKLRDNIAKQELYMHNLTNNIEKAYKDSTEFPYQLHAVIIHEGDAMSGHYYCYVCKTFVFELVKF